MSYSLAYESGGHRVVNLVTRLREQNSDRLDAIAVQTLDGSAWSYRHLFDRASGYATALNGAGVGVGDRVVVQVPKSLENMALYLGVVQSGAVYVTLNTAYTAAELDFFVADAAPALVVVAPEGQDRRDTPIDAAHVWTLAADGEGSAAAAASACDSMMPVVDVDDEAPAAMLYTSGTTGRSKGAVLSHRALANNAEALVDAWAFGADDVLVHALPIFHVHGLFVALHCCWWVGARAVVLDSFDADTVRRQLPTSTVFMGVPTYYTRLLGAGLRAEECTSMRLFTSGSAPMTAETHREFTAVTGHRIVERYGMTEAGMITSNPYPGETVPGSVGFPLAGVELRVVDAKNQPEVPDEAGSVQIRSTSLFSGYWKLPERTTESFVDDWFVTGDIGSLSTDGRLTLEGRASDMIISGGLNIYPKEIEIAIDAVDGVVESAVVGVPHPDFGEAVVAVIVGDAPANAIDAALGHGLARFKHPKHIDWVDSLPRNAMGKIQKNELRARYEQLFIAGNG